MKYANVFLLLLSLFIIAFAEKFSIIGLADPRSYHSTFENALKEARDRKTIKNVAGARFIVVCGDIDPYANNLAKYNAVFPSSNAGRPEFVPVIGNHDIESSSDYNALRETIDDLKSATKRDNKGNYYVDHENARIIVVNAYGYDGNTTGKSSGCVNSTGQEWVRQTIESATQADHVFIGLHDPPFPRHRHVGDSFDGCKSDRNAFWNMLMSFSPKVKAVLVGHTHYYYRMRVKDPDGSDANNSSKYPDEIGGIYQIDCGAAGNGSRNTIINVEIDGPTVNFKVADAANGGSSSFAVIDEWKIEGTTSVAQLMWAPSVDREHSAPGASRGRMFMANGKLLSSYWQQNYIVRTPAAASVGVGENRSGAKLLLRGSEQHPGD